MRHRDRPTDRQTDRHEYRNKEGSQTTLEAETDEVRSKDLKMPFD